MLGAQLEDNMRSALDDIDVFDEHPSLAGSLEDFEVTDSSPELDRGQFSTSISVASLQQGRKRRSPMRELSGNRILSHSRNISRSEHSMYARSVEDYSGDESEASHWEPPAWRDAGLGWYDSGRGSYFRSRSPAKSMLSSIRGGASSDLDETQRLATRVPLPRSMSPEKKEPSPFKREPSGLAHELSRSPLVDSMIEDISEGMQQIDSTTAKSADANSERVPTSRIAADQSGENPSFIKLNLQATVQHRLDIVEDSLRWTSCTFHSIFGSKRAFCSALLWAAISWACLRTLFDKSRPLPGPDLSNIAHVAENFEQNVMLFETGQVHVVEMSETSAALWDLGETVKTANLSSGEQISNSLDQTGHDLEDLAVQMTKFFASVDGDIDGIIMVMEFAKRRLEMVPELPKDFTISTAMNNIHSILCRVGVLEYQNAPTALGKIITSIFGPTIVQRSAAELTRSFYDILNSLEETVAEEQKIAMSLFKLFEDVDRQFTVLHKLVLKEGDIQDQDLDLLLSSLWAHLSGARAAGVRKVEKNKILLSNLKKRTVANKHVLMQHNHHLMHLRANLEVLRRQLVSPLVRSNESSPLSMNDQVRSIEGTLSYLKKKRQDQKQKTRQNIIEASERRIRVIRGEEGTGIESGR